MLTIQDQSEGAIVSALQEQLKYIEDERTRERDYLMDFYEGINLEPVSYTHLTLPTILRV